MSNDLAGPWLTVNASEITTDTAVHVGEILSTPSPYDIPVAVRINEGDASDPAFCVELKYIGGDERLSRQDVTADLEVFYGARSGRIYRVMVDTKLAKSGARDRLDSVKDALHWILEKNLASSVSMTNCKLVEKTVKEHETDLLRQLTAFGSHAHR